MKPASCRWAEASTASISAATSAGAQPCFVASPETFTSTNTGSVPVARVSIFAARAGESSDSIASTHANAWLILLDCRGPIRWMRAPGTSRIASTVARASCTRLCPSRIGRPASRRAAAAARHSSGVRVLTASSRWTESVRPHEEVARSMRSRAAAMASGMLMESWYAGRRFQGLIRGDSGGTDPRYVAD